MDLSSSSPLFNRLNSRRCGDERAHVISTCRQNKTVLPDAKEKDLDYRGAILNGEALLIHFGRLQGLEDMRLLTRDTASR